jgi:predicted transcriptional regulator
MRVTRRKIFPTLLDPFERRLLSKLAAATRCSRSAVVRRLILKEIARESKKTRSDR